MEEPNWQRYQCIFLDLQVSNEITSHQVLSMLRTPHCIWTLILRFILYTKILGSDQLWLPWIIFEILNHNCIDFVLH